MSVGVAPPPDEALPAPPPGAPPPISGPVLPVAPPPTMPQTVQTQAGPVADLRRALWRRSAVTRPRRTADRRTPRTGRWWLMLTRFVRNQLIIFTIASIVGVAVMLFTYMQVPTLLGVGRINVKLELPAAGGLYKFSQRDLPRRAGRKGHRRQADRERGGSDADPRHVAEDSRGPTGRSPQRLRCGRAVRGSTPTHRLRSVPAGRLGHRQGQTRRSRRRSARCSIK